eukprot:gene8269-10594_t
MDRAKDLWDDVRVGEQESASVKAKLEEKEHKLQQATAMYEKSCTGSNDFEETAARIQQVLDEATNELRQTDEENTIKETEITKSNAELRAAKANLIKAERGRDDYVARKKQVEKLIDELRQRAMQSAEADTRGIVGQIRTLEQKLTEMRDTQKGLFQSRQDLMNEITRAEGSLRHAGNNVNVVSTQLQQQRAELQQLRRESGGSVGRQALALYPKGVVDLYNRVQGGRSRFREQVFGPLGLHLTYKEEFTAYERAIERALGPAVFAFVSQRKDVVHVEADSVYLLCPVDFLNKQAFIHLAAFEAQGNQYTMDSIVEGSCSFGQSIHEFREVVGGFFISIHDQAALSSK